MAILGVRRGSRRESSTQTPQSRKWSRSRERQQRWAPEPEIPQPATIPVPEQNPPYTLGAASSEPGVGWTEYTPWLGAGNAILEAIGNALPRDFGWGPVNQVFENMGLYQGMRELSRVNCLRAIGYTPQEVLARMEGAVNPWNEDSVRGPGSRWHDRIMDGTWTQAEAIKTCLETQNQYGDAWGGAFIFPEDLEGGRQIGPQPYTVDPPTVITDPPPPIVRNDPTQSPGPTGPRSRPPQTSRHDPGRYLSLLRQLLLLWQRWHQWQNRQQQAGWTINIPFPGGGGLGPIRPGPGPYPTGDDDMAYINTSLLGGGESGGWPGLLSQALSTAGSIWGGNQSRPGGAPIIQAGFQPALFDMPGFDVVGQGMGGACGKLMSPFAAGGGRGARAQTHVQTDPVSGRAVWFKPAGRPILWSGDLSACKRVRKVASRARRARGGR